MSAEVPPTSLPQQPTDPVPAQTGTTSLAGVVGPLLKGIADALGLTPEVIATDAGKFLGEVLRPIIRQEIQDAFKMFQSTTEIGEKNDALQKAFPDTNPFDRGM